MSLISLLYGRVDAAAGDLGGEVGGEAAVGLAADGIGNGNLFGRSRTGGEVYAQSDVVPCSFHGSYHSFS